MTHREDVIVAELGLVLQCGRGRGRPWSETAEKLMSYNVNADGGRAQAIATYLRLGPPRPSSRRDQRRGHRPGSGKSGHTSCCPPSSGGKWAWPSCRLDPSLRSTQESPDGFKDIGQRRQQRYRERCHGSNEKHRQRQKRPLTSTTESNNGKNYFGFKGKDLHVHKYFLSLP